MKKYLAISVLGGLVISGLFTYSSVWADHSHSSHHDGSEHHDRSEYSGHASHEGRSEHDSRSSRYASAAPEIYKTECGSCHVAYPARMLSAPQWQTVMNQLDKHYGDNASLSAKPKQEITDYLVGAAGDAGRSGDAGNPPRITQTRFFIRKHHEVPSQLWKDPAIKSAANCSACHQRAEAGSYSEREIRLPNGKRWED